MFLFAVVVADYLVNAIPSDPEALKYHNDSLGLGGDKNNSAIRC